jgi:hypothetical protein
VWLPESWKKGNPNELIGREWIDEHRKMMGDGRRPRHDDQIDTGAYAAMELLSQGGVTMFLPHESHLANRENIDPKLLESEQRPTTAGNPFSAGRKAVLAAMR